MLAVLTLLGMLGSMLLLVRIGRGLGARSLARSPGDSKGGAGPLESAVFALLGLLVAFTFSGAASRFDARRHLIVEEANDLGTAWLRLDLLPAEAQPLVRDKFRRYVDERVALYRERDPQRAKAHLHRAVSLQHEIWKLSVAACRDGCSTAATSLVLSSQNQMIDITTTRLMAAHMHPPPLVYGMLLLLVLTASLVAGYGMGLHAFHGWFHMLAFALTLTLAIYVIVDFEYPRLGLLRIDDFDQLLVDLQTQIRPRH